MLKKFQRVSILFLILPLIIFINKTNFNNNYIILAPAHEHHVLALHKHGHRLGGLPTFFWVAIGCLIVVFHLFLFKLIYNEYFNWQDKSRIKYGKLAYK